MRNNFEFGLKIWCRSGAIYRGYCTVYLVASIGFGDHCDVSGTDLSVWEVDVCEKRLISSPG